MVGYRAAIKAILGHLGPAHVRRPQRAQVGAVYTGQEEHLVVDLLEGFHVLGTENITVLDGHRDADGVTEVGEIVLVLEHVDDVRVLKRNHLGKAGIGPYLQRLITEKQ